jgi:short subunit dehydrogenase-like uncharacterized protein
VSAIAVYGASGYTGKLVVREAARVGLDLVLAGRNAEKLHRVADEAGVDAPVRAAAVDDRDALRHALGDCAVVINCAGPFSRYGEQVVRAAVETGTHYLDTTGEQAYMKRIVDRYDDAAGAAEVAVVTAAGFDYVPGDMLCSLVARGHEPLSELVVAYAVRGVGVTRGTMHSGLEIFKGGDLEYADGDWRPAGHGPLRANFLFPPPLGRQRVGKYPNGEIVNVPRHTRTRKVTSLISVGGPVPALAPLALPAFGLALRTPLKPLLHTAIDQLPEGPSEAARRAAKFTIVALAHGEDGTTGRGVLRGSDIYGVTAVIAVHAAELMAAAGYDRAGALSPAMAFEPIEFLDYLGDHGVSYELDSAAESVPIQS